MGKKISDFTHAKINSIIGDDIVLEGNLKASEPVRIEGEINGDVHGKGVVILGKNAKIKGSIEAENIVVGGTVDGDLTSYGRIEIIAGGMVGGNIKTKSLIIDENAIFQGQCTMLRDENERQDETESE